MDFIDEPLVWDKMGPIQYIKHSFAAVIAKLCSRLKNHIGNTDIHVTPEYKASLDELFKRVEALEAKQGTIDAETTGGLASAGSQLLNSEDYILHVVNDAGYIKDIPVCYVTRLELPYLIPTT